MLSVPVVEGQVGPQHRHCPVLGSVMVCFRHCMALLSSTLCRSTDQKPDSIGTLCPSEVTATWEAVASSGQSTCANQG